VFDINSASPALAEFVFADNRACAQMMWPRNTPAAKGAVPDKAASWPSLRRELVRVYSSLHVDWEGRAAAAG
jgi:hypothetical protein